MRLATLAFFLTVATTAHAQTPPVGTCDGAEGYGDLETTGLYGVRARLYTNSALGWDGIDPIYEIPRGGGAVPLFTGAPWIGGYVGGELRTAGAMYESYEFWPGPLGVDGAPPANCMAYDRVWRVARTDLAAYAGTGVATDDLREWPWLLGAPVVDGDGDPTNYNLAGGDYPAVVGDQMLWWVMNDAGNVHNNTGTAPLHMEVQVSVSAFETANPVLSPLTLYRYRLTYRGEAPLDSAFVALYLDTDLGDWADDYIGSDSALGLAYTYNADDEDEGVGGYGTPPPAFGALFLDGPSTLRPTPGSHPLIYAVTRIQGSGLMSEPAAAPDYYNLMTGRWRDGEPFTFGGNAIGGTTPTRFLFPGEPGAYWSEACLNPACTETEPPAERRLLLSMGPFSMEPGEVEDVVFALPWARGADHLDSVVRLKLAAAGLRAVYAAGYFDPQPPPDPAPGPPPPSRFALGVAPSPFTSSATVRYDVPEGAGTMRLAVYDMLGRRVAVLADGVQAPGAYTATLDGSALAPGVYVVRLETPTAAASRVVVRIR